MIKMIVTDIDGTLLPEATPVPPEEIDLVICPCTAFDESGHRLGMGAGYYDAVLARLGGAAAIAAFESQRAEQLPAEPWDVPAPLIFTEERTIRTEKTGS